MERQDASPVSKSTQIIERMSNEEYLSYRQHVSDAILNILLEFERKTGAAVTQLEAERTKSPDGEVLTVKVWSAR